MTSKQRAALKSYAGTAETLFQIGKGGITDNLVRAASDALTARELIKLSVLKTCEQTPDEVLADLAKALRAEPVCAIGNKIVLYRYAPDKKEHIAL